MKKIVILSLFFLTALLFLGFSGLSPAAVDHSPYETVEECLECHELSLPTHRRNVPLSMTEDWPLDPEGRMLCITCHECITGSCVLRKPTPQLCQVCHDCTQGMGCLIGSAHLGDAENVSDILFDCIQCHDGISAKSAAGPGNHRIDILYMPGNFYRNVTDRRIVLIDGRVTCISCHNPYRSEEARLVKSNQNSSLCLTCHIR